MPHTSNDRARQPRPRVGLVMTGGGARGAYQAGVLLRIGEIPLVRRGRSPFSVVSGASAGAINCSAIASGNHDLHACTQAMASLWGNLSAENVYRTDMKSLGPKALEWIKDLSFGGVVGGGQAQSLLDFSPLREFLSERIQLSRIQSNIDRGFLRAAAVIVTNYQNGKAYTFVQAQKDIQLWQKARRVTMATELTVDHVWASAAIPIVFQPVKIEIDGQVGFYGDGCLRHTAPLSPAIRLGAQKVLAIGVRSSRPSEGVWHGITNEEIKGPPLAQVLGVILNAIFLDHLDADVDHLIRLNDLVRALNATTSGASNQLKEPMSVIDCLAIKPSEDLGALSEEHSKDIPAVVRYLMKGLGTRESSSADLMSYLLFSPRYTQALLDIGYRDASARIDEIEHFLFSN